MWIKPILLGALAAFALLIAVVLTKQARNDRVWAADVARLADVTLNGDEFAIGDYRSWAFDKDGPTSETYRSLGPMKISDVRNVWFVLEPHPGVPGMAHTMIVFEFADEQLIGLSVEARKEEGEPYGLVRGTLNGFELIYVWASPKDMFSRRVLVQDHEIYMYRLALSQGEAEAYLGALLDKTMAIEKRPRFYNTFASNCTNELAKTAGLKWHPAFVFTGTADKALYRQGRIKGPGSFDQIRAGARINAQVRKIASLDEAGFNTALLAYLSQSDG